MFTAPEVISLERQAMLNIHVIDILLAGYKSLITLNAPFMHYGENISHFLTIYIIVL